MTDPDDPPAEPDGGELSSTEERPSAAPDSLSAFASGPSVFGRIVETVSELQLSGAISGLAALLAALLVGVQLLGAGLTVLALTAGITLALGLYALNSERIWVLGVAGVVLTPASVLLAATLAVAVSFALRTTVAIGHLAEVTVFFLVFGSFAAVLTAVPLGEEEVLAGAFVRFLGMLVPLTLAQLFMVAVVTWESTILFLARLIVDSPEPLLAVARTLLAPTGVAALLTILVYPIVLLGLLRLVLRVVPFAKLFPPRRRPDVTNRIDDTTSWLGRIVFLGGVAATVLFFGAAVTGLTSAGTLGTILPPTLAGVVGWLLTTVWLRVVLLLFIGVMVAILVAERVRRRARRRSDDDLLRQALPATGAISAALLVGALLSLVVTPAQLLAQVPASVQPTAQAALSGGVLPAALLVTFGSLIVVGILFIALTIVAGSPLLPERALGPALASASVFGLALVLVLFRGSPALAFVTAALALVVWDTGEFATGLREELPLDAPTTRGELVHVGGAAAVAILAVVSAFLLEVLIGGDVIVPRVDETTLAAGALTIAFGTVIVLVSALRD